MSGIKTQVGDWYPLLEPLFKSKGFENIRNQIKTYKSSGVKVLPDTRMTFRAFKECQYKDVQIVILGQDPYHDGRANGLAFANSSSLGLVSPSLRNIWKSLETDFDVLEVDFDHSLESWARQGVLLLNTALTVEKGKAGSHLDLWRPFTERFITALTESKNGIVFMLWGKKAQYFEQFIVGNQHVLKAAHPAAEVYSGGKAGFFTCKHFTQANELIDKPVRWSDRCVTVPF